MAVLANLAPRKLRGMESKGMILYGQNEVDGVERWDIVTTDAPDGNVIQ